MRRFEKWVSGQDAEDTPNMVAASTLEDRFNALQHFLELAARHPEQDVEHIHQLRVWTRRTVAAVQLYREFLPQRRSRWLLRKLKAFRRAAGKARDLDVMAATEKHEATAKPSPWFQKNIAAKRKKAQRPILRIWNNVKDAGRLRSEIERSVRTIRSCHDDNAESFHVWARRRLRPLVNKVLASAKNVDPQDPDSLHQFRIRSKKVRYAMELLAPAFEPEFRDELYPVVQKLLQRLGEIHDCDVARHRFRKWRSGLTSRKRAKQLKERESRESQLLRQLMNDFTEWWTPEFIRELEDAFVHHLDGRCRTDQERTGVTTSSTDEEVPFMNVNDTDFGTMSRAEQIRHLEVEGFLVLPRILDTKTIHRIKSEMAAAEMWHTDYSTAQTRSVTQPQWVSNAVAEVIGYPPLIEFLNDLMGPDIVFTRGFFQRTLPGSPGISMHTDGQPHGSDLFGYEGSCPRLLRVLFYLDDLTPDRAPFRLIPRSHLSFHADASPYSRYKWHPEEITVVVPAGSAVLVPSLLHHGSHANKDTQPRELLQFGYRPAWAGPIQPVDEWDPALVAGAPEIAEPFLKSLNTTGFEWNQPNKPPNMRTEAPGINPSRWGD